MKLSTATFALRLALGIVACSSLFAAGGDAGAQPADSPAWARLEDDLRIALQGTDNAKIRELISAGANVNARDVLGGTALHVAANFRGELEILRLVLDRGAQVDALNSEGYTPLLTALRHGHYKSGDKGAAHLYQVAELLLSRGASVRVVAKDGETPIRAAMEFADIPLIRLLVKRGAVLPDEALGHAISFERPELARLAMELATPRMLAFKGNSGASLMHLAAAKPRMLFVMQWLAGKGADVNALDDDRVTPFGNAVFSDNLPAMNYLQSIKANLAMTSTNGASPLHLAAYGARHDVMRWVIERGGDTRARDKWGRTPLDIAIDTRSFAFHDEGRKLALVTLLGGSSADIARGRFSRHPLHEAVNKQDIRAVGRLLEAGADVNVKNESGHTALYWAIALTSGLPAAPSEREFGEKLLPLLLRHGADPKMHMGDGSSDQTYEQYARSLRMGDKLDSAIRRYAPRGTGKVR